ncbi:MAG: acyl-CoA thioester hydrolase/BAAT C-terminal domain-containing protein [Fuerstiella sp.]
MAFVWTITSVAVLLIMADIGYRQFASRRICRLFENVPLFGAAHSASSRSALQLSIPFDGSNNLKASLHSPSGNPIGLIIFCPELRADHWSAEHYCSGLVEAGFAVLSFEFRDIHANHLQTDTPRHWVTESEIADIEAVLKFVKQAPNLNHLPLGIFGVSRGGAAALVAACRFPQITSAVTDGAYSTMGMLKSFISRYSRYIVPDWFFSKLPAWHVEFTLRQAVRLSERKNGCRYVHLEREAANIRHPVLLISGNRDSYVTPVVTQHIANCLQATDCVWLVEKARHNKSREVASTAYDLKLITHFHKTLCPTAELGSLEVSCSRPSVA